MTACNTPVYSSVRAPFVIALLKMTTQRTFVLIIVAISFLFSTSPSIARRTETPPGNRDLVGTESESPVDEASHPKLKGHIITNNVSQSWLGSSEKDINESFMSYSSTGGADLCDEIPRDMMAIYTKAPDGWSHYYDKNPQESVPYPSWNLWHGGLHSAMYQLRWELVTDPEQRTRKLGRYYLCAPGTGSSLWNTTANPRPGIEVVDKEVFPSGDNVHGLFLPGLSYNSYFKGNIRVLVEIHRDSTVRTRIISSTLPNEVTMRLQDSILALSGHPLLNFPQCDPQLQTVTIIYNMSFNHPQKFHAAKNANMAKN